MLLTVSNISKSYPGLPVLHDVSLSTAAGEIVCLLGPSGCGKTTLLRIVAGLETPDTGRVTCDGQDLAGVPTHRRGFGFMFQDYALFPHRDVKANVAFGLRMQGLARDAVFARVREMLDLVALSGYEDRRVIDLSGGEQQRVALARSLAPGPRLLMLDEPLGALDRALREQLMNDLRAILKSVGVTALYVTHDQEEAFAIADRVVILRTRLEAGEGGRVEQVGAPSEVYRQPVSLYVARFLGFRNFLDGTVLAAVTREEFGAENRPSHLDPCDANMPFWRVDTPVGDLVARDACHDQKPGDHVTVLVRPEAADVRSASATGANVLPGRLLNRSFRGSYYLIRTRHAHGIKLTCEASVTDVDMPEVGADLALWLDPAAITLLPRG